MNNWFHAPRIAEKICEGKWVSCGGKRATEACQRVWRYQPAVMCDTQSQRSSLRGTVGGTVGGVSVMMLVGGLYRSCRQKHRQLDSGRALADARVTYKGSRSPYSTSRWGRGEGRRRMWCLSLTAFFLWLCHLSWLICFSPCLSTSCLFFIFSLFKGCN